MNIESIDDVKEWLKSYQEKERDIDFQIERLERLEESLISPGSPVISDMPRSPSPSKQRMLDKLERKEALEEKIRIAIAERDEHRKKIEMLVRHLSAEEKAVIEMRYIDGANWNEITDAFYGRKDDFLDREDTYSRRVFEKHRSALFKMAECFDIVIC